MMVTIMFACLTIAAAHLALGLILWLRVRKLYSYPGQFGSPILGNLYYFYKTLFIGSVDGMYKYGLEMVDKYGKGGLCFGWIHGFRVMAVISSPDIIKEIAYHQNLSDKPDCLYGGLGTIIDGPLCSTNADNLWKIKRKEYNIFFRKSHVDNNYYNNFIKCGNKLVELLLASPSAVDVHHKMIGVSHHLSLETLFGVETSLSHHPQVINFALKISGIASFFLAHPNLTKLIMAVVRTLDVFYIGKLAETREMILDHASAKQQCPLTEQTLSVYIVSRCIKSNQSKITLENELLELFGTSSHTVTVTLSSSIIFLALLPDIQEKAWQEQFEIFGNDDREPTMNDLERMQFLGRVIKEALRFTAPPYIGRLASRDININRVTIPQGASVIILLKYMRMDPKHWVNPNMFNPDRFLEESNLLKHAFTPFGIGIRNCPGKHFAMVMMKVTLSKLLRRLKVIPVDDKVRFEDIKFRNSLMSEVVNPPLLRVEERI